MSLYKEILQFDDFFYSIRVHEGYLVIDLKLPINWEDKRVLAQNGNKVQMKVNSKNDHIKLISFFAVYDQQNSEILINEIIKIIKWNKDIEEKNNLLNQKMLELRKVFEENNIDSLRKININFLNTLNPLIDEKNEIDRMVRETISEGPKRD